MTEKPTKQELLSRMTGHIAHHNDDTTCKLIWKGYLAALMEWGLLQADDYHELNEVAGEVGQPEIIEIFLGYPGQYD
jgi:hypothetical protein